MNEEKLLETVELVVQKVLDKKRGKHDRKAPRKIRIVRASKKPSPPWYIEEIKKGRPLNDAGFLCRLLDENIIRPTIYGRPLTQEQKEGLIRFIESRKDLLFRLQR